jgi:hypothetical protein
MSSRELKGIKSEWPSLQVDFLSRNFMVSDIDMRINFTVIVVSSTNTAKGVMITCFDSISIPITLWSTVPYDS